MLEGWASYVRPVDLLIPARKADTERGRISTAFRGTLKVSHLVERRTENGIKGVVCQSAELLGAARWSVAVPIRAGTQASLRKVGGALTTMATGAAFGERGGV